MAFSFGQNWHSSTLISRNVLIYSFLSLLNFSGAFAQTTAVTVSGMGTIVCPAEPNSVWTGVPALPASVTFSPISRGPGVTCVSASDGINGSGFNTASADDSYNANLYYSFTITNAANGSPFQLKKIVWVTAVSGSSPCKFTMRYINNGGPLTDFGTPAQTSTVSNTFSGSVTVEPGTTLEMYAIPHETNAAGRTVRFKNNSSADLPVELSSFTASPQATAIQLNFTTETERDNDFFSIERSGNGIQYAEIGQVQGAGTSYEPKNYVFTDERPLQGRNYYRLRQVDFDRQFSFSPVVMTRFGKANPMTLAPLPATETLNIQMDKALKLDGDWQIFDLSGRLMMAGAMPAETNEQAIPIYTLPAGGYVLRLVVGQEVMVESFRKND